MDGNDAWSMNLLTGETKACLVDGRPINNSQRAPVVALLSPAPWRSESRHFVTGDGREVSRTIATLGGTQKLGLNANPAT